MNIPTSLNYILFTRFIKHAMSQKLQTMYPVDRLIKVDGGLGSVKAKILELAELR
jgi:hypothetical protein